MDVSHHPLASFWAGNAAARSPDPQRSRCFPTKAFYRDKHKPPPGQDWDCLPGNFHGGSADKESACKAGDLGSIPAWGRSPRRRERLPTPGLWPGDFHGLCSLWGCKESATSGRLSHTHTPGTQVGTTCVLTPQAGQAVSPRAEDGFPRPKGQRVSGFGQSDLSAGKGPECFQQPEGLSPPLGQQPSYVHGAVPPLVWAERKAHEIAGQSKEVGFLSAKGRPHPGGREPGPPNLTPNREQHPRC